MLKRKFQVFPAGAVLFLSWSRAIKLWFPTTVLMHWFNFFIFFFSPASTQSMKFINSSIPNQWEKGRRIPTTSLRWELIYNASIDIHIKISKQRHYISTTARLELFLWRIKYIRQKNSQMLIIALDQKTLLLCPSCAIFPLMSECLNITGNSVTKRFKFRASLSIY